MEIMILFEACLAFRGVSQYLRDFDHLFDERDRWTSHQYDSADLELVVAEDHAVLAAVAAATHSWGLGMPFDPGDNLSVFVNAYMALSRNMKSSCWDCSMVLVV
jgi:hypothetical protein